MNRKLFNGLLLLTVATGGIGTFTSCKDTEQDFRNEVLGSQEQLKTELSNKIQKLNEDLGKIRDLTDADFLKNLDAEILKLISENKFDEAAFLEKVKALFEAADSALESRITAAYEAADAALEGKIDGLQTQINSIEGDIMSQVQVLLDNLQGNIDSLKDYVDAQDGALDQSIQALGSRVTALDSAVATAQTTAEQAKAAADAAQAAADLAQAAADLAQQDASAALTQAGLNAAAISALDRNLTELQGTVGTLQGELGTLQTTVGELNNKYTSLSNQLGEVEKKLSTLTDNLSDLKDSYDAYVASTNQTLSEYANDIASLKASVASLYSYINERLAKLVTGIELNQVHNAIFGSFNVPVGINSNIVANYFALSDHKVVFPPNPDMNDGKSIEYSTHAATEDLVAQLTAIDAPFQMVMSANVPQLEKLADIYMTVNPAERDLEGLTLSLVNSQDEAVPVLDELELHKTNKVLTMGYSRAADNGFYVAEAKPRTSFTADELEGIRYDLEPGLKSAFKDALKDRTKANFEELAKLLLKQLNKDIPAYAIKCEWDDKVTDAAGKETVVKKSVRSNYDLAVLTFRPLSYSTGYGFGVDINLPTPTIGYIKERINDAFARIKNELQLGLTGVNVGDISIDLSTVKINIDAMEIEVNLSGCKVYSKDDPNQVIGYLGDDAVAILTYTPGVDGEVGTGDLAPLANAIKDAIEDMLSGAGDDSLTAQIERQLKDQIQGIVDDINEQLEGVQSKINNTVDDIHNRILAELDGRYGRIAEHLLDLYNKLADKLTDVLADPNAYLQVLMAYMGNDDMIHRMSTTAADATPVKAGNNMELFATSYNAEIIVPSYKKYVAVVDAFETANPDNHSLTYAKEANEAEYLNVVRPGDQQRFYLDGSKLHEGYTYKVVYSSLDYHGYTSTQVYYVKVTK